MTQVSVSDDDDDDDDDQDMLMRGGEGKGTYHLAYIRLDHMVASICVV